MDDDKIFRKAAIERLSSPENLDQVMHVVSPKNWAALICLFVVVAAAVAWACFGEIARLAEGKGALLSGGSSASESVIAVLTAKDGRNVQPGMEVHITLDSVKGASLTGRVVSVSAIDGKTLTSGGLSIPEESIPGWEAGSGDIAALIKLDTGEMGKAAEALSAVRPQMIGGSAGWFCEIQIIIESYHPIRLIHPE